MAASRKFLFDDPDDDYWNQSSNNSNTFNFEDGQANSSATVSFSQLRKNFQDAVVDVASVGSDEGSDQIETVDWSGLVVESNKRPAVTSNNATLSIPPIKSSLGPTELLSTASRSNAILYPPTNKMSMSSLRDPSPNRTGSAGSVSSLDDMSKTSSQGKREYSPADHARLESEYRKLKLKFEHLRHERYRPPDVKESIKRLLKGETAVLELYKSKQDKMQLLDSALEIKDGNVILAVILFLKQTLADSLFRELLLKNPSAANHYITYLRDHYRYDELTHSLFSLGRTEEAAVVEFRVALKKQTAATKVQALNQCLQSGYSDPALNQEAILITEYRDLLERQQPIDTADDVTSRDGHGKFKITPKVASLVDQPVLTTLYYCCLYHYDLPQESNASPLAIRQMHKLNEKQYCWVAIKALARQRRWSDIEKLITTKRLLIGPKMKSPIPYEKLVDILQKHGASPDVVAKYLRSVSDINERLSLAIKSKCHDVVTDCFVALKDKQALILYAARLTNHTKESYYANAALQNVNNKWKN